MKKTKSLTRKAQGEETRAALIETGAHLFAMHGFHGVSMRKLAAESGVNLATVGYHFGGKLGLYEAILQDMIVRREEIFPTPEDIHRKFAQETPSQAVAWFMRQLVHGILGREENIWPIFIISRELAQPTELYPKLEQQFFHPAFEALRTLAAEALPEADEEERVIVAHCIIGVVVKFLEGINMISARLGWDRYRGRGLDKISTILEKRINGFLGLPMENAL